MTELVRKINKYASYLSTLPSGDFEIQMDQLTTLNQQVKQNCKTR